MESGKPQGIYTVEKMIKMATVAQTANGLNIQGNNFKVGALTGCPDMVLFACERIKELESVKECIGNDWLDYDVQQKPLSENSLYWVKVNNKVILARFNDYGRYGGSVNYWQDFDSNDLPMGGTFYIEIKKPEL